MNRNSKLLRKSLAVAGAVTLSLSMCSPVLAADVSATGSKLTDHRWSAMEMRDAVTSTGKASSVSRSLLYTGWQELYQESRRWKVLTLVVDGPAGRSYSRKQL